jgi:hypothetical protein
MKATNIVHWPGRDTIACDAHTLRLVALSGILGFQLSLTPCVPDLECTNCENEKAKRSTFANLCDPFNTPRTNTR